MPGSSATRRSLLGFAVAALARSLAAARCEKPPRMVLRTRSGRQRGERGTYCWSTCCVDYGGQGFPADALDADHDETPLLDASALGPLAEVAWTIWPTRIVAADDGLGWSDTRSPRIREETVVGPAGAISLPNDLPHGLYLIEVFAVATGGDTLQGFRLSIGPAPRAASASTPSATLTGTTPPSSPTPTMATPVSASQFAPLACPPQPPSGCTHGPPRLELRAASGCQLGAQGSWCWSRSARSFCCADSIGIDYPLPPLVVTAGETAALHADHLGPVGRISYRIANDPSQGWEPPATPPGQLGVVADARGSRSPNPTPLPNDLTPGDYLIDVTAQIEGRQGGSLHQGFRIRVVPIDHADAPAGATAASPAADATTPVAEPGVTPVGRDQSRSQSGRPSSRGQDGPLLPRLELRAVSGRQVAGLGSYCWPGIGCGEAGGIAYPAAPLVLASGEAAEFTAASFVDPVKVTFGVFRDAGLDGAYPPASPDARGAVAVDRARIGGGRDTAVALPDHLPPGDYFVAAVVAVRAGGSARHDAHQGFRIRVVAAGEPEPEATPVSSPAAVATNAADARRPHCLPQPDSRRPTGPPRLALTAASGCQLAGLGSYCWAEAGCGEAGDIDYPSVRLVLEAGESAAMRTDWFDRPIRVAWGIFRDPGAGAAFPAAGDPQDAVAAGRAVHPEGSIALPDDLPPGDYLVSVEVRGGAVREAAQGFRIRVLPAADGTTPAAAPLATPTPPEMAGSAP